MTTGSSKVEIRAVGKKTLVIGLGQIRGSYFAWNSMIENLLYPYNADLALLIPEKSEYSILHEIAEYIWDVPEYDDWGTILDDAALKCSSNSSNWRILCNIPSGWFGGVKNCENSEPNSAGILLALRLILQQKFNENGLLEKYDMFVLTRVDYLYLCKHHNLAEFSDEAIYVPVGEEWGGWTDRHLVASGSQFYRAISYPQELICSSHKWMPILERIPYPQNIESLQKAVWREMHVSVRQFPPSMFTVKTISDPTRHSVGDPLVWNSTIFEKFGLIVKYGEEMKIATRSCNRSLEFFAAMHQQPARDLHNQESLQSRHFNPRRN